MTTPNFSDLSNTVAAEMAAGGQAAQPSQAAAGNGVPPQGTNPGAAAPNTSSPPSSPPAGDAGQPGAGPSVVSSLRDRGYDIPDTFNDDSFLDEIASIYQRSQSAPSADELKSYEQIKPAVTEYAANRDAFLKWQAEQAKITAEAEQASKPTSPWNPPEVDPHAQELAASGVLKRNERGDFASDNPLYQGAIAQLNRLESYKRNFFRKMEQNPVEFFDELLSPRLAETQKQYDARMEELQKRIDQFESLQKQSQSQDQIGSYFQQNAERYWQIENDEFVLGSDNQPVLTQEGHLYATIERSLQETIEDPVKRHEIAVKMAADSLKSISPAEPAAPQADGQNVDDLGVSFDPNTGEPITPKPIQPAAPKPSQRQQAQDAMLKRHRRATPTAPPQEKRNEPASTPAGMRPSFKGMYDQVEATMS